jgi:hypothetical protein
MRRRIPKEEKEKRCGSTYFSAIAYTLAWVTRCAFSTSPSGSEKMLSTSSSENWAVIGVSGSLKEASSGWNVGSSAGGVNGIELFVAEACANSGSSIRARFSFLGASRLEKRDVSGEPGQDGRCDER